MVCLVQFIHKQQYSTRKYYKHQGIIIAFNGTRGIIQQRKHNTFKSNLSCTQLHSQLRHSQSCRNRIGKQPLKTYNNTGCSSNIGESSKKFTSLITTERHKTELSSARQLTIYIYYTAKLVGTHHVRGVNSQNITFFEQLHQSRTTCTPHLSSLLQTVTLQALL